MKMHSLQLTVAFQLCLILFITSCQGSVTSKQFSIAPTYDSSTTSKVIGGWCYQEKDSVDTNVIVKNFALPIVGKKDSLFGYYQYIFGNGRHINGKYITQCIFKLIQNRTAQNDEKAFLSDY